MFRFSLRFWALMQYIYSLFSRNTSNDRGLLLKNLFIGSCIRGHTYMTLFFCMDEDHPELLGQKLFSAEDLQHMIFMRLKKLRETDPEQYGLLHGFIESQWRHMQSCVACQKMAIRTIYEDASLSRFAHDVMRDIQIDPPPDNH